ncbi:MAG: two-component sensor histidine kinase, partial [Bacteroidetes bacterium]
MFSQSEKLSNTLDSIVELRKLSKDQNFELEIRLIYANKAVQLSLETKIDSTILRSKRDLSFVYLQMGNFNQFGTINHTNLNLAHKLNDSSAIAITNYNLGAYHHNELNHDSAYYYYSNAVKIYNKLKDIKNEGELLLNMADIQETEKDYIGAEINAVRAISLIETLPKNDYNLDTLWSLYNLLGVISGRLQQYDDATDYHEQALTIGDKISGNFYYNLSSNNNLAFIYEEKGEYLKALSIYEDLIEQDNLYQNDPSTYALLLRNIAHAKFQSKDNDHREIEKQFIKAYRISDSIEDDIEKMKTANHFSEFLFSRNQKDSARFYAQLAYKISKKLKSNDFVSKSLLLLSKINEGEVGKKYLYEHIKLNDSLLNNERNIRNKFARIEFETDKIEAENIKISRERLIFLLSSVGLLLTILFLYIIISQRIKNRKLEFTQKQQEANEEIYNLMLAQQDKIDEGRTQEKKRISEELHDGILGRLFGTRLSLDSLNMLQTEDAIINREGYINELKTIEEEIRKISHDLNTDFVTGSSFMDIVKTLIETQTLAYQLEFSLKEDNEIPWDDVSNKTKIHIYRVL